MADDPFSYLNPEQRSAFADVEQFLSRQSGGALGDEAMQQLAPIVKPDEKGQGINVILRCESGESCGRNNQIGVDWRELVWISQGVAPQGWFWHQGTFRPNLACACGTRVGFGMTPDECKKLVQSAIAGGRLPLQTANALAAETQQARR